MAGLCAVLALAVLGSGPDGAATAKPEVGQAFVVPYRLTDTNHFLVRVRINGKGPFNFLVDTGAPALFVSTETAAKAGLVTPADAFWAPVDRLDFEGGASLQKIKARVDDPFQLVGMNALGLPGATIDGILGYTVLARFRMEIDPGRDRMTWTRLAFEPADPPVPPRDKDEPANGMGGLNALGPLAKLAAALIGRQPEDELAPRGFLGIELASGPDAAITLVSRVVADSPAARGGVRQGDRLIRIDDVALTSRASARAAVARLRVGQSVRVTVRHPGADAETELSLTAGEGF